MHRVRQGLSRQGFALPTVLIASIVLLTVLAVSVSATAAVRTTLKEQYYAQLAQVAGEAGVAYAKACLAANGNVPQWTDLKPLTPATDCSGNLLISSSVRALVVGGGGGGASTGGGGGAGGFVYNEALPIAATNYTITVGAGGAGGAGGSPIKGAKGQSSSIAALITAEGGGGGATHGTTTTSEAGGSGGGAAIVTGGAAPAGGAGSAGNAGGAGFVQAGWVGNSGGGGGAGGVGGAGGTTGGAGGAGAANSISGASLFYAGGGAGGEVHGTTGAAGGSGGGGASTLNAAGTAGTANTGGGGGGGAYNGSYLAGGAGGSGIVVIAYPDNGTITATGGTITTAGLYKIHTFTTTGTSTFAVSAISGASCPSDPRCSVTVNDNVRSSFRVGLPTLDSAGKALTIPNSGYVEVTRTSNGSVWRTYTQPSVQAAVVPDLCSGAAQSSLGWNNAVRAATQDSFSLSPAAQTITNANGNVNAGTIYFRKDFTITKSGTYSVSALTPSAQDIAEVYIDGVDVETSAGSLSSASTTLSTGCHTIAVRFTNATIAPRPIRFTAAVYDATSNTEIVSTDASWRVSSGNAVHYSQSNYDALPTLWTLVRDVQAATTASASWAASTGDSLARFLSTTHNNTAGSYPASRTAFYRDTRDLTVSSNTTVRVGALCDDSCTVYLDGQAIQTATWSTVATTTLTLTPGTHRLGVAVSNGAAGASGFSLAVVNTSGGAVLRRSDSAWVAANFWNPTLENYYSFDKNFVASPETIPSKPVEVLVVAGGASGGTASAGQGGAGGGGAGGVLADAAYRVFAGDSLPVTVGAGGAAVSAATSVGNNGANSVFGYITALGGGGGGRANQTTGDGGAIGGSGGGAGYRNYTNVTGSQGTEGHGNAGGNNTSNNNGGGGGGAGGPGGNTTFSGGAGGTGGAGGVGLSSSISGSPQTYGVGGNGTTNGFGFVVTSAAANTGNGGTGGVYSGAGASGAGGSGIVIVRYILGTMTATGGSVADVGGYRVHTFTSSGTFTVTSIP